MPIDQQLHSSREPASSPGDPSLALPVNEYAVLAALLASVPTDILLHDRADQIQPARQAVRELVRAFRLQEAVKAEDMVLALRDWYKSGVVLPDGHAADQTVWTRLVAMCLDEFYADE